MDDSKGPVALLILFCLIGLRIDDPVGQHSFCPQLQSFNRNGNPFQLLLDVNEVIDLIVVDLSVCGDFDEPVLLLADRVQGGQHLQNDGGEFLDLDLRHILLADGTLVGAVVIAEGGLVSLS